VPHHRYRSDIADIAGARIGSGDIASAISST
jgi:hypothetical protein